MDGPAIAKHCNRLRYSKDSEQKARARQFGAPTDEKERAYDFCAGQQQRMMRMFGNQSLRARRDDEGGEEPSVRRQNPARGHGAKSGSRKVCRAVSLASRSAL